MEPHPPRSSPEPIAIVGMGCRFPGGIGDPASFWRFLRDGGDAIGEVPPDRWNVERFHHRRPGATGKMVSRRGGFLDKPGDFDAAFFGLSPREAARMDPQQRWLLELTWETLEDAGIPATRLKGSDTGVFLGISNSDYGKIQQEYPEQVDGYSNSGNALSIASNRIAFWYDWKGPALSIDTACSSSLVAINRACRSLWSAECSHALAGGVSAIFLPDGSIGFSKAGMLSPDGVCRAFDAKASGYVRSEGAGCVLLKTLSQALADGDAIHATILASVVNQDGRTSSMTVPSMDSQSAMLEQALDMAGIRPSQVVCIEAHGTGTPVGDPIEARALGEVLARGRNPERPCLIGSVKTNLGHLEPASGIAGLIKAALMVREGRVPASLHFRIPNPHIDFAGLGLEVAREEVALPVPDEGAPVVVVNSFGFGGTNAQCLLAPPPPVAGAGPIPSPFSRPLLLPLSAAERKALENLAERYHAVIPPDDEARPWCLAAAVYREALPQRLVVLAEDAGELRASLASLSGEATDVLTGSPSPRAGAGVAMVFTGQGSQYAGMGRALLALEPVFSARFDEIAAIFQDLSGMDLREKIESGDSLDATELAQPAIFAIQGALLALWESWGIRPAAVIGHSLGEVAAAYAAGIYDLDDAVRLVHHRSRLQARARGGGMAAVAKSAEAAGESLADWPALVISAWNSPSMVTIAGDAAALEAFLAAESEKGVFVRRLPGDHAFHTNAMDPIEAELRESLSFLRPRAAKIPFFSTVTGTSLAGESLDATYWWRNVREPVSFVQAVTAMGEAGFGIFLEVGPHPALSGAVRETLAHEVAGLVATGSLHRDGADARHLAAAFARLWIAGASPDWRAYLGGVAAPRRELPHYPWQHRPFWMESPASLRKRTGAADHPLLGLRQVDPSPAWEGILDPRSFPWLEDHRFWNRSVFPASGFVEMIQAVGHVLFPEERIAVESLSFERFLSLSSESPPTWRIAFDEESRSVKVFSRSPESTDWHLHAKGRVVVLPGLCGEIPSQPISDLRRSLPHHLAHWDFYESFAADGYDYGTAFQGIEQAWYGPDTALAEIHTPEPIEESIGQYRFHPSLLDACFQTVRAAMESDRGEQERGKLWLPVGLAEWVQYHEIPARFYVSGRVKLREGDRLIADLECLSKDGQCLARIRGFALSLVAQAGSMKGDPLFYEWRWVAQQDEESTSGFPPQILILGERSGFAAELAGALEDAGTQVAFNEIPAAAQNLTVLHLAPLEAPNGDSTTTKEVAGIQKRYLDPLLALAHQIQGSRAKVRVWSIARHDAAATRPGIAKPVTAAITGFRRVASSEMPAGFWASLLLETDPRPADLERVLAAVRSKDGETEIAWFEGRRHVARFVPTALDALPRRARPARTASGEVRPYALEIARPGTLEGGEIREFSRRDPGPGQVEVRVATAGVNFRDLLKLLGRYPGTDTERREWGDDFAGTVSRVGEGVTHLQIGDRVAGVASAAFRTHLVVEASGVMSLPPDLDWDAAATLPTVFLTAHHALVDLGRMQKGESILIHAAAGGVGLAAIQIAQGLGLEIFATAGSEEKRAALRELGVPHVMDSRSLDFVGQVRERTQGRGVDAVLNSLAGEFLVQSLGLLAPFGRFLEIGKMDLFSDRRLPMGALRDCISFLVIDMDRFLKTRPAEATRLYETVVGHITTGRYRPIPFRSIPVAEAATVFREMARGQHFGKRVLDFRAEDLLVGVPQDPPTRFRDDRTYLVAGGHSGFGFATARWLAARGARHLALLSRSGPRDESVRAGIADLVAAGVSVYDLRADLTEAAAVSGALDSLRASAPPIAGVIHAAMVLEDRFLTEHDAASFARALDPKTLGAWHLHEATLGDPIELFLVYSSIAAAIGSPRQSNYAAGNTFLEGLVRYRRAIGRPGLAIEWGALSGSGYVERNEATFAFLEKTGSHALPVDVALTRLAEILDRDTDGIAVAKIDWAILGRYSPTLAKSPVYRELPCLGEASSGARLSHEQLRLASPDRQLAMVEDFLVAQIAAVFGSEADILDRDVPVTRLGLDSLMAIELLHRIESSLGIPFPMGAILSGPSIHELAASVLRSIQLTLPAEVESAEGTEAPR